MKNIHSEIPTSLNIIKSASSSKRLHCSIAFNKNRVLFYKFLRSLGVVLSLSHVKNKTNSKIKIILFYYNSRPFWTITPLISKKTRKLYVSYKSLVKISSHLGSSIIICLENGKLSPHYELIARKKGAEILFILI